MGNLTGTGPKIHLDGTWVAVGQEKVFKVAEANQAGRLNSQGQLILLAIGRANNGGHAIFKPSELESLLGKPATVDLETGEVIPARPLSRSAVDRATTALVESGFLVAADKSGGQYCLWLNSAVAQRSKQHGAWECPVHQTFARSYG